MKIIIDIIFTVISFICICFLCDNANNPIVKPTKKILYHQIDESNKSDVAYSVIISRLKLNSKEINTNVSQTNSQLDEYLSMFKQTYQIPNIQTNKTVKIAVIDSGINTAISNIQDKIYNPESTKSFYGYDLTGFGIKDSLGHGTNVSGIILGVNSNVKILPIKIWDEQLNSNEQKTINTLRAIELAIALKVDIINISGGGESFISEEFALIKKAQSYGIIVVSSLGNESQNLDSMDITKRFYPASYNLENIIAVANYSNKTNKLNSRSNYSKNNFSLSFNGEQIESFNVQMTGTSQSAPFITGAVSILISKHYSLDQIKRFLSKSTTHKENKTKLGFFDFNLMNQELNQDYKIIVSGM